MKCLCGNANPLKFDDVSDLQTGTMYARCQHCGKHTMASAAGFVDWHVGLMLESRGAVGSAWTQKVAKELFVDFSRLSNASR